MLDLPFRMSYPAVRWYPGNRCHAFIGAALPDTLVPYRSQPYTLLRRIEDSLNPTPGPAAVAEPKTPRAEQVAMAEHAVAALRSYSAAHLSAAPGTGKTCAAILAVRQYLHDRPGAEILIVVDRPTALTIPSWREWLAAVGDGGMRWTIVSPDSLGKLVGVGGKPLIDFDLCIIDEVQAFRHPTRRTQQLRQICRFRRKSRPALLTITATLGHNPAEYLMLAPLLAAVRNEPLSGWSDVGARLIAEGLPLEPNPFTPGDYRWNAAAHAEPRLQQHATEIVQQWLLGSSPPAMVYQPAPWGPPVVKAIGVDLTAQQRRDYALAWSEFRRANDIARSGNDGDGGRAALVRFRQKAAFLRVQATVDLALSQAAKGRQVVIAVSFVSAAGEPIADAIEAAGVACARLFGDHPLHEERMAFQRGHKPVCVLSKTSAISLQANEEFADGTRATSARRIGIWHMPSWSGIEAAQTIGRIHRFHEQAPFFLLFSRDTVEERAATVMVQNAQAAIASGGASIGMWSAVARTFGVQWLTPENE